MYQAFKKTVSLGLATCFLAGTALAGPADIRPHRAIYTLKLDKAKSASGVVGASGQMFFEWADACDGWVIEQRYRLKMAYNEADELNLNISFVTWESKDGSRYRFTVKKWNDGELTEELAGTARTRAGKSGEATFTQPERSKFDLPRNTLFPSAHTIAVLEAAKAGQNFFAKPVFDGGLMEGASDVTAGIGAVHAGDAAATDPLLRARWWPVRIAFFNASDAGEPGEGTPTYELGMTLLENGIARGMTLDYGDYSVKATLDKLEALPRQKC
ncbi:cell envelope integrity EipB family protein [Lacibacterium aquatile]|uniref:Cell envelope integrity EipB family protein n=1 Tax=Lacibacterium aquatile TaxID=1168082 RepID=A0ABW5DUX7_9PROT